MVGNRAKWITKKAKEYIDENLCDANLSVELIASYVGISTNYLRTVFRHEAGTAISKYIKGLRLERVCEQLLTTNKRVEEIAVESGFIAENNIYAIFKRRYGMTPAQYKQIHINNAAKPVL